MEVLLLLLPQAHPIDDLGEHLEKRLAVWPQEPVSPPVYFVYCILYYPAPRMRRQG